MQRSIYKLVATILTPEPERVEAVLVEIIGSDGLLRTDSGFRVATTLTGGSATELNDKLLSSIKRAERNAVVQTAWTHDNITERFVGYLPVGIMEE